MKRKSKKQVGTRLVYKLSHKFCTLLEINDTNFTVEFDDKSVKTYSLGSLESKFNLADNINIDPVFVAGEKQDCDVIVGQVEVVNDEEDTDNIVHKLDNKHEQITKLQQENEDLNKQLKYAQILISEKDKKLEEYEQIIKKLSSQVQNSDKLLNDCKKLVAENDVLKEQVNSVHKLDNEHMEQTGKLLQENSDLKNQITELTEENKRLSATKNKQHAGGRPKKFSDNSVFEQMQECKDNGESYRQIAKRFKCSSAYVFKVLNQQQS